MRESGYNAVSFRDIAAEIGIKSASLHYHFPKKADLGLALVQRYSDNLRAALQARIDEETLPLERIEAFVDLHRQALTRQQLLCLCAVFGAEARGLPKLINDAVAKFFRQNIDWLAKTYLEAGVEDPNARAKVGVSLLEGALIVADSLKDETIFEAAADFVLQL